MHVHVHTHSSEVFTTFAQLTYLHCWFMSCLISLSLVLLLSLVSVGPLLNSVVYFWTTDVDVESTGVLILCRIGKKANPEPRNLDKIIFTCGPVAPPKRWLCPQAAGILCIFVSTYVCEQLLWRKIQNTHLASGPLRRCVSHSSSNATCSFCSGHFSCGVLYSHLCKEKSKDFSAGH